MNFPGLGWFWSIQFIQSNPTLGLMFSPMAHHPHRVRRDLEIPISDHQKHQTLTETLFFGWCSKNSIGWPPNKSTHPIGKLFYQISKSSVHMIWMRICVSSGFLPRSSGHFDPDGCSFHAAECGSHGLALPRSERSEATAASRYGGWRCLGEELSKYGHLDWTDFNLLWYTLENTWNYTKIVILPGINGYEWVLMGRPWDYMVMYRWFTLLKILVFSHSYVKWNDWWYVRLGQSNVASWKISSV